jgi:predicted nucleic acid-binding protein
LSLRLVVDASVACKWLIPESLTLEALSLISSRYDLLAPDHILPEVYNVLGKKVFLGEITPDEAQALKAILDGQPVTLKPFGSILDDAFMLALSSGRAVYDCIYLALALEEQCQLVTADRRFVRGLEHTALSGAVVWLGDVHSTRT